MSANCAEIPANQVNIFIQMDLAFPPAFRLCESDQLLIPISVTPHARHLHKFSIQMALATILVILRLYYSKNLSRNSAEIPVNQLSIFTRMELVLLPAHYPWKSDQSLMLTFALIHAV